MNLESGKSNKLPLLKDTFKRACNSDIKRLALNSIAALMLAFTGIVGAGNALAQEAQTPEKPAETEKLDKEKLDKVVAETKVERPRKINKQPFVDLLTKVKSMKDLGDFDLRKPLEITVTADRSSDGTLGNVTVSKNTGGPKVEAVARDFMAALKESNALDFLEGSGPLNLTAKLNKSDVALSASSEVKTAARAAQLAKGYNALLAIGRVLKSGRDEETVYEKTTVSASGKQLIVNLTLSRAIIGQLLSKQLPSS